MNASVQAIVDSREQLFALQRIRGIREHLPSLRAWPTLAQPPTRTTELISVGAIPMISCIAGPLTSVL